MTIDDGREDIGQVTVGLDLVQFAGFNQRRDDSPILRPFLNVTKYVVIEDFFNFSGTLCCTPKNIKQTRTT